MVKRLLLVLPVFILFIACKKDAVPPEPEVIETEPSVLTKRKLSLKEPFRGYYEGLPANYSKTNKSYPLLVFLHGLGQKGDGDTQLFLVGLDGLGALLENKSLPPNFKVDGKNYSFIYICPQYWNRPTGEDLKQLIDTMKVRYRVDAARIYISGLSVGGEITTEAAASYPFLYAAIAPLAGTTTSGLPGDFPAKCKAIAQSNLPIWAFHNEFDPTIPRYHTEEFINKVKSYNPKIMPKYTMFPGSFDHNAWAKALNPTYKEDGKNLYEWMLTYKR